MYELTPGDFGSLSDFPLIGRWTRATHDVLPPDVLDSIRPLTVPAALAIASEAERRGKPKPAGGYDAVIAADAPDPSAAARALEQLGIAAETPVIVSWSTELAVVCPWRVFVAYWDAFCYPSSDDVTIWSPAQPWTLNYRHWEIFELERSSAAG